MHTSHSSQPPPQPPQKPPPPPTLPTTPHLPQSPHPPMLHLTALQLTAHCTSSSTHLTALCTSYQQHTSTAPRYSSLYFCTSAPHRTSPYPTAPHCTTPHCTSLYFIAHSTQLTKPHYPLHLTSPCTPCPRLHLIESVRLMCCMRHEGV